MSEFKIGDRVKIDWAGNDSDGKIGTIVKSSTSPGVWTIKIPGFDGHVGDIEDGTEDKWYVPEENLTKLPETKSMKIEVKQSEKPKKIVYPCFRENNLGFTTGVIVLFFSEDSGIVVDPGPREFRSVGYFSETWNPEFFSAPLENYSATISSKP